MSETESDEEGFDKEAEKRRLREKYEADRKDREATSRMSDLLLQGATMTNKHCDVCGSPLFRYQGQEFCPSCQAEGDAGESAEAETQAGGGASADAGAQERTQRAEAAGDADAQDVARHDDGNRRPLPGQRHGGEPDAQANRNASGATAGAAGQRTSDRVDSRDGASERPSPSTGEGDSAAVADARDDLAETVSALARRAAAADDPRQARELAEAAREAAEGLAALR